MTYLIVPAQAVADEIFSTPDFDPNPTPVKLGVPLVLADNRLCFCHPWGEVATDWLTAYVAGIAGAEVIEGTVLLYPVKESDIWLSDSES